MDDQGSQATRANLPPGRKRYRGTLQGTQETWGPESEQATWVRVHDPRMCRVHLGLLRILHHLLHLEKPCFSSWVWGVKTLGSQAPGDNRDWPQGVVRSGDIRADVTVLEKRASLAHKLHLRGIRYWIGHKVFCVCIHVVLFYWRCQP